MGQHGRNLPAQSFELVVDHTALVSPIAVIIINLGCAAEGKGDVSLIVVTVQECRAARNAKNLRDIGW